MISSIVAAEGYSREYARDYFQDTRPFHATERFLITAVLTRVFTRGKSLISLARKENARAFAGRSINRPRKRAFISDRAGVNEEKA
jgi:hypothetical protein